MLESQGQRLLYTFTGLAALSLFVIESIDGAHIESSDSIVVGGTVEASPDQSAVSEAYRWSGNQITCINQLELEDAPSIEDDS